MSIDNIILDDLCKWQNGIELVHAYGHMGLVSLRRNKDPESTRGFANVSGVVGYCFKNNTGETIEYLTEEVSFNEETGMYEGKVVTKSWSPGTKIDLTKTYTTHLFISPELNCKCKNATLVFSTSARAKKISERINLLVKVLDNKGTEDKYSDEQITTLRNELNELANELAGTCYLKCSKKNQSVHDDQYKKTISVLTNDGEKIVDPNYIKTFGLLNNSLVSNTVKKLESNINGKGNKQANLLNKANIVLGQGLLDKIAERSK